MERLSMRIGVMLRHLGELGGIVVYTKNVLENLLEIDKKNEYIFLYNSYSLVGTYSKYSNVRELVIDKKNKFLWDQYYVPKVIKSEKIELVFNPKLSVPIFAPAKKVLTMHGLEQFALPKLFKWYDNIYFHIMMPLFCRYTDSVIVMTEFGRGELIKYLKAKPDKIEVISESYHKRFAASKNETKLSEIKKKYNLPDRFVLFVGGLVPLKNFSNILRAYNIVKNKTPVKLVVAGFKRFKYQKDLDLINRLKLKKDLVMLGFVPDDDLPYLYCLASCFVFPSLYEGFGIPVIEAQACGCPVVSTTKGATPEVSGGAAMLVNPYNHREIAQALYEVLTNDELKVKLVKDGFENAKRFSWLETSKKTLKLFEKMFQS
jgi:glycosyltransferase involved in cell wall biosynthesis